MFVKEKDNGNWIIQKEKDEELSLEEQNFAISIVWHIPDMVLLGEQGCAGNFDMYQYFYNYIFRRGKAATGSYDSVQMKVGVYWPLISLIRF